MRTSKPVSTISFNTLGYIELKLDELVKAKKVSVWHFIAHKGENDECQKKDHVHLYIEPSILMQVDELLEHFKELDPCNSKPRMCLPFRSSQFDTWYLYAIHDKDYLMTKPNVGKKKYHYAYADIKTSNSDDLYRSVSEIDVGLLAPVNMLKKAIKEGNSFAGLVAVGRVPLEQLRNYKEAYQLLQDAGRVRPINEVQDAVD